MDPYIGKMLDNRYEILERIGTGGMAVVYKAKCHRLNRLVAVKILKSDLAQDEDLRRRFNAESQAVAQLSHPNIVSVYDVSRGGGTEYIVMELIDGITLKQYMKKRGQLNWRESLHFITQIMRGLSHAHSRGIVHRDIKPQNIMVLRDGSVRVADFGIACLENSAQTLTQEALGSVHYISPEQARGDRIDARSDIYSAGVVLYEMLAGRLPFEGDSAVSVAIQHLSSIPLAPREINPDIPETLELICMKAMAPDLSKRYPSADAMIADLEAFRKNPDVDLDFEMESEEVDEPTRPLHPAVHSAAKAADVRRREPETRPQRSKRYEEDASRGNKKVVVLISVILVLAVALVAVLFRNIANSFEPKAPEQYIVPSVVGLTIDEANNKDGVKDVFKIQEQGKEYSTEPIGTIVRQDPNSGEYRKGDNLVINIWVSAGEDTIVMEDLSNLTVAQAKAQMKSAMEKYQLSFDASDEYLQFSTTVTEGYIISTIPAAGEVLHKGDTIRVIVSKGPEIEMVVVPLFIGQNIDKIRQELQTIWKLTCTDADIELVDSKEEAGTIIWQSIESATETEAWTPIRFKVSTGIVYADISENYSLPQDDRETVHVVVTVDGAVQYDQEVRCDLGVVQVNLRGHGVQNVQYFFDDVLQASYDMQFS